ncbi:MAG: chemotaxis protein CheW [Tepidanaerobacteraceae bacterium]|jgi:purine-binding chemotaxis protein CheW|nr:chemotaxis protein CheW [Tepidanaerobacteraceae bacterium]
MPEERLIDLLKFKLGGQFFGIYVEDVREIIRIPEITKIPDSGEHMEGIVNLRDKIIPVYNLAGIFGKHAERNEEKSRVLVLEDKNRVFGFIVDEVTEVIKVSEERLETGIFKDEKDMVDSIVKDRDGKLTLIIDIKKFSSDVFKNHQEVNEIDRMISQTSAVNDGKERHIITFKMDKQEFGVEVKNIKEIIRYDKNISAIPNTPGFIEGMINLREELVPVISLRSFFNLEEIERDEDTRILIIINDDRLYGFVVDRVNEVLRIPSEFVSPPPALAEKSGYIYEVAKRDERLIMLLDTVEVLKESGDVLKAMDNKNDRDIEKAAGREDDKEHEIQVVTFEVNGYILGFEISSVKEINRINTITPIPCSPPYIRGIVNLRGELVTLIDIKNIFYGNSCDIQENTRLIIMERDKSKIGIIAEKVYEVKRVKKNMLEEIEKDENGIKGKYIKYIIKNTENITVILDEKVLFEL